MVRKVLDWLEERTGYRAGIKHALDEPVRGGASWAYVFGSVLTFILINQMVTGVFLAMYYSPSSTDAWGSVWYIQTQVTMGWFVRGLHSYGASAMVIVAGLHMLQTAIYGAYKKPREVNWIVGVLMLGLILAFALTGYLLPWDQKGYWATKVATGIMGSTPLIGEWLQRLVQGGNEYGNLTLTRFYAIHVFILPATIILLLVIHLKLFRRHGVTPKWGRTDAELDAKTQPFWPDQLARDMVAIAICFGMMAFFAATRRAELTAPADPGSAYDARPEWYFLPLFQVLKYFSGALETIVALGLPAVVGAVLLGLPFADRKPDRSPARRVPYIGVLVVGMAGAGALALLSYLEDKNDAALQKRLQAAHVKAQRASELAREGIPPAGGPAVFENDPLFKAEKVWNERCAGCHVGDERKGPEITAGYNNRAWIRGMLLEPRHPTYFGTTKIDGMKPTKYEGEELAAVVEAIYAESGAPDVDVAKAAKGRELFDNGPCSDCHWRDETSVDGEGPNLGKRGTPEYLRAFILDPGSPRFFGKLNEMPAFRDKLSDAELELVVSYVRSLQGAAEASPASSP